MNNNAILTVAVALVLALATGPVSADLVGHWAFDETGGTIAVDSSGNGNDGTLQGDPQWVPGVLGGALEFDGVDDYVDCGNDAIFDITDELTLAIWVNANDMMNGQHNHWLGKGDNTYAIKHQSGNYIEFFVYDGSWHSTQYSTNIDALNGEWHHMAGTFDGSELKFYLDAEEAATLAFSGTIGTASHSVRIGENSQATGRFFDGMLDDARIYNHAMTPDEILQVMLAEPAVRALSPAPPNGSVVDQTGIMLQWRPGNFAASHVVYFGEDAEAVRNGQVEAIPTVQAGLQVGAPAGPEALVPGQTYYWRVDEVNDVHPESPWVGDVWSFRVRPLTAWNPSPADGVPYITLDQDLAWDVGTGVLFHNVYTGTDFEEVSNTVAGAWMTIATTYDPGPLEPDTIYYWRVDEFSMTGTHKGDVWSFTTVPTVDITDPDLAGWWTLDEGVGTTAVDWSGHGLHGTIMGDAQWEYGLQGGALSLGGGSHVEIPAPNVETNTVTMTAWVKRDGNQNNWAAILFSREGSEVSGFGFGENNELRYHWTDLYYDVATGIVPPNQEWFFVALVVEPTQATIYFNGTDTVARNEAAHDPDPFDGVLRIGRDNPGRDLRGTVDDVRFYSKALSEAELQAVMRGNPSLAWNPSPAAGAAVDVRDAGSLSWSAGNAAASHDVYFGTDGAAVTAADAAAAEFRGNQVSATFSLAGLVELGGGDYYWRIDEVTADGTTTQKGYTWKFTIPDYLPIDDFESYTNNSPNRVFQTWTDGLGFSEDEFFPNGHPGNGAGALVGHDIWNTASPHYQGSIIQIGGAHGGDQSMPLYYNNTATPYYSEADRTWQSPQDWTVGGVTDLTLYVRGDADNEPAPLYVVVEDSLGNVAVVTHPDAGIATAGIWTEWRIPLGDLTATGVDVTAVTKLSIGAGNRNAPAPGGSGVVYLDDVRITKVLAE